MKTDLIFHQVWWSCSVAKQWSWKHDDIVLMKQPKQNKKPVAPDGMGEDGVCVCVRVISLLLGMLYSE